MHRLRLFFLLLTVVSACNEGTLVETPADGVLLVEPGALDFGEVILGESGETRIRLRNTAPVGSHPIRITGLRLPQSAPRFSFEPPEGWPLVIEADTERALTVRFEPQTHLQVDEAQLTVETASLDSTSVGLRGTGIACEPLAPGRVAEGIPATPSEELLASHGTDPRVEVWSTFNGSTQWFSSVRFGLVSLECAWIREGVSLVGLSGTPDGLGPWGVDNLFTVATRSPETGDLVLLGFGGSEGLTTVRDKRDLALLPHLWEATVPGEEVGVPAPYKFGFPPRGEGAVNLASLLGQQPVHLELAAYDFGGVGARSELFLVVE